MSPPDEFGQGELIFSLYKSNFPHPLAPSPKVGEGGQEAFSPLSQPGRGDGGEGNLISYSLT